MTAEKPPPALRVEGLTKTFGTKTVLRNVDLEVRRGETVVVIGAMVLLMWVRRFLCRHCRVSVSCLPEFAQPYRPVNTPTVEKGFNGEATDQTARWIGLIECYYERFESHLPVLLRQVGNAFGPMPLQPTAKGFWRQLMASCGDLGKATRQLVHQFHTCLFGNYRCHQRRQPLQVA